MGTNDRQAKTSSNGKRKSKSFDFKGYVDVPLTAGQQDELTSEFELSDPIELIAAMNELLDNGYELKFKLLDGGTTVACQIMDVTPERSTFGWILTGFSSSADKSLFVAYYKHTVICEGVWDTTPMQRSLWG